MSVLMNADLMSHARQIMFSCFLHSFVFSYILEIIFLKTIASTLLYSPKFLFREMLGTESVVFHIWTGLLPSPGRLERAAGGAGGWGRTEGQAGEEAGGSRGGECRTEGVVFVLM